LIVFLWQTQRLESSISNRVRSVGRLESIGDHAGREKRFLHTLNSTAIATSRALRAIFENYQRADGSLEVPPVLREYMGGLERIEPGESVRAKK
jgi:seryl-tRNA synthetase